MLNVLILTWVLERAHPRHIYIELNIWRYCKSLITSSIIFLLCCCRWKAIKFTIWHWPKSSLESLFLLWLTDNEIWRYWFRIDFIRWELGATLRRIVRKPIRGSYSYFLRVSQCIACESLTLRKPPLQGRTTWRFVCWLWPTLYLVENPLKSYISFLYFRILISKICSSSIIHFNHPFIFFYFSLIIFIIWV